MANNPPRLYLSTVMALNKESMVTRQKRHNYFLLNDVFDNEAAPEDQILDTSQSDLFKSFADIPSSKMPSKSASQTPATSSESSILRHTRKRPRPAPVTN
jgi:hypothetical protein